MEKEWILEETRCVMEKDTAEALGSGDLPVYATPALAAFMEHTAKELLKPMLKDGETTVGTHLHLDHLKATGVGETVRSRAELLQAEGRKMTLRVEVFEGDVLIGTAIHERVIVNGSKFMNKINNKI